MADNTPAQPNPSPSSDPAQDVRKFWPKGAIPKAHIKKWGAVAAGVLVAVFFLAGGKQQPKIAPPPTVNQFDPAANAPPSPAAIAQAQKDLAEQVAQMERQHAALAQQSAELERAQKDYQSKMDGLKALPDSTAGQLNANGQPATNGAGTPGTQPAPGQAPPRPRFVVISAIVQDLRHQKTVAPTDVAQNTPAPIPQSAIPTPQAPSIQTAAPTNEPHETQAPQAAPNTQAIDRLKPNPEWPTVVLPEGTVLESVLENKLEGSNPGEIKCMLTTNAYVPGTHTLVFPQGTEFLGQTSTVSGFGQDRLAIIFHRAIVHPHNGNMYSIPLDHAVPGLDQEGATGVKDQVNQHLFATFAAAGVIGGIAGLSEIGNSTTAFAVDPAAEFRTGVTQNLSQESMQILNHFLNRLPTITIRPGNRVKLMLVADTPAPVYREDR